jgi:hypothetical protein
LNTFFVQVAPQVKVTPTVEVPPRVETKLQKQRKSQRQKVQGQKAQSQTWMQPKTQTENIRKANHRKGHLLLYHVEEEGGQHSALPTEQD